MRVFSSDITDPGNYGAAVQNVNYDQVSEVKVQVSNFGADTANGPVVIGAVTKAGGDHFHGSLYTYARTYQQLGAARARLPHWPGLGCDLVRPLYRVDNRS